MAWAPWSSVKMKRILGRGSGSGASLQLAAAMKSKSNVARMIGAGGYHD